MTGFTYQQLIGSLFDYDYAELFKQQRLIINTYGKKR